MAKQKKYYVVWKGREVGVFERWDECKKSIHGFAQAQYKSFTNRGEAERAFKSDYERYKGKNTTQKIISEADKKKYGLTYKRSDCCRCCV